MEPQRNIDRPRACLRCRQAYLRCNRERPCKSCIKCGLQGQCIVDSADREADNSGARGQSFLSPALVTQQDLAKPTASTRAFDHTGQICPVGRSPRVTATLWEVEGTIVFHVECKGVTISRREDNHMVLGSSLLNVASRSNGSRDAILDAEKTRHNVDVGPTHLKGVWVPFERALELANQHKITEDLYPLFVHDIGALLYNPVNQNQTLSGPCPPPPASYWNSSIKHLSCDFVSPSLQHVQPPPLAHTHVNSVETSPGTQQAAIQAYQAQLILLEQENKKRLLMARQEQDRVQENYVLQDYQGPLITFEQQKVQREMDGKEKGREESQDNHALQDKQLMHLEQQSRQRRKQEQEVQRRADGLERYLKTLKLEERRVLKRRSLDAEGKKEPEHSNMHPLQAYDMQLCVTSCRGPPTEERCSIDSDEQKETLQYPISQPLQDVKMHLQLLDKEGRKRSLGDRQEHYDSKGSFEPVKNPASVLCHQVGWEEVFSGNDESPPSTPRLTPPESPLPTSGFEFSPTWDWPECQIEK